MDETVLNWLNVYAAQSETFDRLVSFAANNALPKGVPVAMLFLFLWFLPRADQAYARVRLIALVAISFVAIAVGKAAALSFPYRPRPLHNEALDLELPISIGPQTLDGWSSFPSDHAVLYGALATGFWMVNRWAGLAAVLHALLVIAFSRVYLTLHYPTDILGGAAIGLVVCLVLMRPMAALVQRVGVIDMAERWPQYFHPLFFVMLFQIATMFTSARQLAKLIIETVI
ncbi:phosphatase PAP2 family protein (plasmid) [Roseobacter denitrificans]|uniref:PAP2 superfamily protein, putative n=1 Tax=Roseobacter denitrificans (strain ATCC 33942 / OCh 114) TaxID=375451 RepID=Q07GH5_ROSDO|nr:phosphatase PAP2 family protein [Roseobacter denitrificans]ABI93424.1 PAP2 superfamily protein, putative [Roseobacter denitrificans OCh 114]AVL55100.1 phosphatase PAP2 family protein [Roseobacter denitrificans]SFG44087.1 undecaprenyl-diphosphatase [Roseobacter denitrificans OCh 114]